MELDTKRMKVSALLEFVTKMDHIRLMVEEGEKAIRGLTEKLPLEGMLVCDEKPYYGQAVMELATFYQNLDAHLSKLNTLIFVGEQFVFQVMDIMELTEAELVEAYIKMME